MRVGLEAEVAQQRLAPGEISPHRREDTAVDAERLVNHLRQAAGAQVFGDPVAGREHEVEAFVQPPQPLPRGAVAPARDAEVLAAELLREAQQQRRHVAVAEGDCRHAQAARRMQRRAAQRIRIGGFDDVGRAAFDHPRREPRMQHDAIAARARQAQAAAVERVGLGFGAGGDDRVLPAHRAERRVLGADDPPHAAGRAPEHRRVEKMHGRPLASTVPACPCRARSQSRSMR